MRMQEPEQPQSAGQQWQTSQQYGQYHPDYSGSYEQEQQQQQGYQGYHGYQEYMEGATGEAYSQQKIYPQQERRLFGTVLGILAIILSSLGFFLSVAGIVASALVLKYANGRHLWLTGGGIGLAASIIILLICVGIFVISVITLALRATRTRRQVRTFHR